MAAPAEGKRVAIFGGSFNPPHVAHVLASVWALSSAPVDAVLGYAYRHSVTQIVVGESLRSRWQELTRGSFVTRLIRAASNMDIHVISRREQ